MAKLTTEDLSTLTRQVEEIEKTGGEAFALTSFTPAMLIPVEAAGMVGCRALSGDVWPLCRRGEESDT